MAVTVAPLSAPRAKLGRARRARSTNRATASDDDVVDAEIVDEDNDRR